MASPSIAACAGANAIPITSDFDPMPKDYPHQEGIWTLTAPDGRVWKGDSPLKAVVAEQVERIPATVRVDRLLNALRAEFPKAALSVQEQPEQGPGGE